MRPPGSARLAVSLVAVLAVVGGGVLTSDGTLEEDDLQDHAKALAVGEDRRCDQPGKARADNDRELRRGYYQAVSCQLSAPA